MSGRVLITGASGFIGKKIALHFLEKKYDVIGWDRSEDMSIFPVNSIDMSDFEIVLHELKNVSPDIVVHCAGSADVGKSVQNPELDFDGNVKLTHNLLFAMHKLGMNDVRLVFLSSAGVYGNPKVLPITEDMELKPMSPYAVHKVMCEDLCMYFVNNYGMDVKIARVFSAYGVGLKKQIFWDMYSKLKSTGELKMFGTGNESRDYINVVDVVQAIFFIAVSGSNETVYNVANGEEVTIRQVTEYFAEAAGVDKNCISFNGVVREGDPLNWKADISRIKTLGYVPTVDMKQGLNEYYKWVSELE